MEVERVKLEINGIVQGVGFRPTVYNLARKHNIKGFIRNTTDGVFLDIEGDKANIREFIKEIQNNPPPLARIKNIEKTESLKPEGYNDFKIKESRERKSRSTLISPDIATCRDCREELLNPDDRRFQYPFINCTNCGPRFTITEKLPYDRKNTTMKKFSMCNLCYEEYENPADRRFHAQPNACEVCGPSISLLNGKGEEQEGNPIKKAIEFLTAGKILAIKGLGGFHLACDAERVDSVRRLRKLKNRPEKPLALMAEDVETIEKVACVSTNEKELLRSPRAPIVLLKKIEKNTLPEILAPDNKYLGFMLPYTPLHILLFQNRGNFEFLVMTSANRKSNPIISKNENALAEFGEIADYFLLHNREIHVKADDSVTIVPPGENRPLIIRRSRGYVPEPIKGPLKAEKTILGCGSHLRNTFCLMNGDDLFLSHHLGDLDSIRAMENYRTGLNHFKNLFNLEPDVIAVDMHPSYNSSIFGRRYAEESGKNLIEIQHHHAQGASCMVDNEISREMIGVVWDGTGYGEDGAVWGGEFLVMDLNDYIRFGHLDYIEMPGGEKAIQEPWRMALTHLYKIFGKDFLNFDLEFLKNLDEDKWEKIKRMLDRGINTPLTSSMGRLFDTVAALINLREEITFHGQAAIELEMCMQDNNTAPYIYEINREHKLFKIDTSPVIRAVVSDITGGCPASIISKKFHLGTVKMMGKTCSLIREETGINDVLLSGGVFQNIFLRTRGTEELRRMGFRVYNHHSIPPNDGGLSAGQAAIAASRTN